MARIRTVKPDFFTSLTVARLDLLTRLTFIGLWTYVDDEGRAVDNTHLVKAALFPLDDDITPGVLEHVLNELSTAQLIHRYVVDGKQLLRVVNWQEHQVINRATKSHLPAPSPNGVHP